MTSDLGTFAAFAIEQWIVPACTQPNHRAHERRELADFDREPRAHLVDDPSLITDHQPQHSLARGASERGTPMTERERDLMFQTGLRQLASQRVDDAHPVVKTIERPDALLRKLHAQRIA